MSKTTYLKTEGITYEQGYGDHWYSHERGIKEGEMRVIDHRVCYANSIYFRGPAKSKVVWVPVEARSIVSSLDEIVGAVNTKVDCILRNMKKDQEEDNG